VSRKITLDERLLGVVTRRPGLSAADYHRALFLPPLRVGHLTAIHQATERLVKRKLIRVDDTIDGPVLHPVPPKKGR